MNPVVSIITVNLNNRIGLRKTIQSVVSQKNVEFEYIVIDGSSNDGSKSVIEEYEDRISYWISERDHGIFNAMNKGISKARGIFCLFLNSGDFFFDDNCLEKLVKGSKNFDLIYGDLLIQTPDKIYRKYYPEGLTFDFFYNWESLPHPATLIKKSLFNKVGLYREDMKISADGHFFLNAIAKFGADYIHIKEVITVFDGSGISGQNSYKEVLANERSQILSDFRFYENDYSLLQSLRLKVKQIESSRLHQLAEYVHHSAFWNLVKKIKFRKHLN